MRAIVIPYKGRLKPKKEEHKVNPIKRLPVPPTSPSAQGKDGRRFGFNIGFYIALSILLLVTGTGWGQGNGWKWLTGGYLKAVKFVGQQGWIIGDDGNQGIILHTTDGGNTWAIQPHNTGRHYFNGLVFVDSLNGWIAGGYQPLGEPGFLLRTRNGGQTWVIATAPVIPQFNAICFLDTTFGWLTGNADSIFRTTDGGNTWNEAIANDFYAGIDFVGRLKGWATSGDFLASTTDGGVTWRDTLLFGSGSSPYISMADSMEGWLVGLPTRAVHTVDGWRSWQNQAVASNAFLYNLTFPNASTGYIVGGENNVHATIIRTTDRGNSWSIIDTLTNNWTFKGVDAEQLPYAWVAGDAGSILKTTTSGNSWTVIRNVDIGYDKSLNNVLFYDTNRGWAVGTYGAITHTTNGGTIWRRQPSGVNSFLYGVSFADTQYGKICTGGGGVLGTRNGGNTWAGESTGASSPLWSIDYPDTDFAVAVGGYYGPVTFDTTGNADSLEGKAKAKPWSHPRKEEGKGKATPYRSIIRTTNGGSLWIARNTSETPLYGVKFITRGHGWACGDGGVILRTTDLGATWQTQSTGVTNGLYWITFKDTLHGWACGSGGRVLWTTDGGNAWNTGNSGVTQYLNSIAFADTLTGFAVSDNGLIIRSTDGGRNWVSDTSKVYANLTAVCALDSTHVWTVGSFGMVLGWGEAGNTGIEERVQGIQGPRVQETALGQSYPNPTTGIASFEYELGKAEKVKVKVYNVAGQAVKTLVEGLETAGRHIVTWDGRDGPGRKVGSGTYFYCLEAGGRKAVRKMVIIR
jgi:photosystem II stability/assembly factor-like uncharacterized protein